MTVTVTTQTTPTGVFVIVKLLLADVDDLVSVKKLVEEPSGAAFTSIVTPCGGMADVMDTVNGKSVWGAAGWTEFAGGLVVITKFASVLPPPPPPPPPLSEQVVIPKMSIGSANTFINTFFILAILLNAKVNIISPIGRLLRPRLFMKF